MQDFSHQLKGEAASHQPAAASETAQRRAAKDAYASSPRLLAQRQVFDRLATAEPAQRMAADDEEELPLQAQRDPVQRIGSDEEEELPLQGQFANAAVQRQADLAEEAKGPMQAQADESRGGLPAQLRTGIEALSGMDMSNVRVHRNSSQPAQLNALAYAQGNDIHLGPGQEQHLPHEAWHVVQQRQGRVRETVQMAGVGVNDEVWLERAADVMGGKAVQGAWLNLRGDRQNLNPVTHSVVQRAQIKGAFGAKVIQRRIDVEKLLKDKPELRELLFNSHIGVDDLEEVQELLEDGAAVGGFLRELEQAMVQHFQNSAVSGFKYTRALDMALWEQEKRWAIVSNAPRSTHGREVIPANSGQEGNDVFLGRIRSAKPLKDVGAAVSHGEYAHRIQWYVITRSAFQIGSLSPQWLRTFYSVLGDERFVSQIDDYVAPMLQNTWTLWNALVDVPGSVAEDDGLKGSKVGSVGFSAPVRLNNAVSKGLDGLQYSQLRLAVLNRRLKRYFQADPNPKKDGKTGRLDAELAAMLQALPATMDKASIDKEAQGSVLKLLANAGKYAENTNHAPFAFNYDQRNAIAFALCGIPF